MPAYSVLFYRSVLNSVTNQFLQLIMTNLQTHTTNSCSVLLVHLYLHWVIHVDDGGWSLAELAESRRRWTWCHPTAWGHLLYGLVDCMWRTSGRRIRIENERGVCIMQIVTSCFIVFFKFLSLSLSLSLSRNTKDPYPETLSTMYLPLLATQCMLSLIHACWYKTRGSSTAL